jgi:LITAF-like zinc ribbon domain
MEQNSVSPSPPHTENKDLSPKAATKKHSKSALPSNQSNSTLPNRQNFVAAVQLQNLKQSPSPVDCPLCGVRAVTNISFQAGNHTQYALLTPLSMLMRSSLWALGLCFFTGFGFVPYFMESTKDVVHRCGNCGIALAKWNRSGSTEVFVHGMAVVEK